MNRLTISILFIFMILIYTSLVFSQETLIVDHNAVVEFDQIPDYWIGEVKKMMINIPGESHGLGYMYGLELLEGMDSKFTVNITWTGEPEAYEETHLRSVRTYRNQYGNWSESGGEEDFYTSQSAIDMMKNHIDYMRNTIERGLVALSEGATSTDSVKEYTEEDDAGRVIRVTEKVRILPPNEKAIQILCKKYAKVFDTDAVHEDAAHNLTLSINTNAMSLREIQQLNASSNPLGDASKVIDAECNEVTSSPPRKDSESE